MERHSYIEQARQILFGAGQLEREDGFRATLAGLACSGLQWGGVLGLLGVLILIAVNVLFLGRPLAWWYTGAASSEVFVLVDEVVVAGLCGLAAWIGRSGCRLSRARVMGGALTVAIVVVSLLADAYRGVLSVEYFILAYLLAVTVIPYRPWHAFLLGGVLTGLFFLIGHFGLPGTPAARPGLIDQGHLVSMSFVVVVLTGISALLYSIRHRQYQARREAEALHDQVARLERAKSRFFADLSHEFRTPLTLILGPLQDALEGRLGTVSEALRERLEAVGQQAHRMKRLVDELFELARLDEGEMPLALRREDVVGMVEAVAPPLRQWAEEKGLDFQVDQEVEELGVWVDTDRFRHLLTTLFSNAVRHTPEGGRVRIRVGRADGCAEIAVRDAGPGLPERLQERIFGTSESYIPLGGEGPSEGETDFETAQWIGMGIGLAHANALARRHGGTLEVESESGFGTELTVRIPLGREHVAEEDIAGAEETEPASADRDPQEQWRAPAPVPRAEDEEELDEDGTETPEVLVVDDDSDLRAYLAELLGSDYQVVTAANGEEALHRLHARPIDLVVSDVAMPEMDGIALCREIRTDEQLRHLPVLLLTARPEDRARRADLEVGADAYVSKPFDPGELIARVENLIEIRRIVQDRIRLPDWMDPEEATVSSEEAEFIESLNSIVDEHIGNSNFGVDWLADEMDLSARHLRRRIKDATGLSAAGFVRTRRLQHAASLLEGGADTVSEVASAVGYRDPSYFSRLFRETFGCSPTEYAERKPEPSNGADTSA